VIQSAEQTFAPLQRYEQIAARLRADVREGRLAPGERLPSERELARRLGVGRASLREALAALGVEGVLVTRPGAGSFVAMDAGERVRDGVAASPGASPSDLLEARALFEPAVARLAAERAKGGATPPFAPVAGGGEASLGVPGHDVPGGDGSVEALLAAMDTAEDPSDPAARAAWNAADRRFHRELAALTGNPVLLALADQIAAFMDQPLWQRLRDEAIAVPGRTRLHAAEHRLIHEAILDGDGDAAAFQAARHLRRVRRDMTLDPNEE